MDGARHIRQVSATRKIQDESEAKRMLEAGVTYPEMVGFYREKYGIETTVSMWSSRRSRWGIEPRVTWDRELVPWRVKKVHSRMTPYRMITAFAADRRGEKLEPYRAPTVRRWVEFMKENNLVLRYEPDTEQGWFLVPRGPDDIDLIRIPAPDTPLGRELA